MPEPGLVIVTCGRRDVPFDYGLPIPLRVLARDGNERPVDGWTVTNLNDQHAYVSVPADSAPRVGDRVVLGISHPCTAFDKWRIIPVVDDHYNVTDAIRTYF